MRIFFLIWAILAGVVALFALTSASPFREIVAGLAFLIATVSLAAMDAAGRGAPQGRKLHDMDDSDMLSAAEKTRAAFKRGRS